ncbi:hypothetical protein B9Z51_12165 [Limnohabitans sp. T6-5]|uniref:hypothetical protein n=1 Tax=Limnohabitans sp. T6-5 TaxID=1100724 RepID=UPI000D3D2190|nr:hypothetical protein [Limnohabitans sp. T6-5]PUE06700.1 hypothetical protein B9Z51_12165 [Limnohabitans sp. T6-5]
MKEIEGHISLLGNAVVSPKGITTYSVIKIDEKIIQKVRIPTSLDSFLIVGERVTIYMRKSLILGVKREDGVLYCYSSKIFLAIILILLGIPLIPFFGIGILFVWMGWGEYLNHKIIKELENKGAIPINM